MSAPSPTKSALLRIERINAARTLLGGVEERLVGKAKRSGAMQPVGQSFMCPEQLPRVAPRMEAGDRTREWVFAEPAYLLSNRRRGYGDRSIAAVHEAGHFVVAEFLLKRGARISAFVDGEGNGTCSWDQMYEADGPKRARDAAAIAHAGAMAELSISGEAWSAPIRHAHSLDWATADRDLEGSTSMSGAHAVAQKVALILLEIYWDRVREVAKALYDTGRFTGTASGGSVR